MVERIEEVQLVACRESNYTMYVFKKINSSEFIMCTRLPNWQVPDIKMLDVGFLQYHIVKAGDVYFDPKLETTTKYNYSNVYFINFILKTEVLQTNNEIIL